jgi:hypothetical protein
MTLSDAPLPPPAPRASRSRCGARRHSPAAVLRHVSCEVARMDASAVDLWVGLTSANQWCRACSAPCGSRFTARSEPPRAHTVPLGPDGGGGTEQRGEHGEPGCVRLHAWLGLCASLTPTPASWVADASGPGVPVLRQPQDDKQPDGSV